MANPTTRALTAAVALVIGCMAAGEVAAQAGNDQVIYSERPPEFRDPVATYLDMKRRELSENEARLNAAGAGANIVPLYNILKEERAFDGSSVVGGNEGERTSVRDVLTRTAAQYLASVGFTPNTVARLRNAGVDLVGPAARTIAGTAGFEDLAVVAETVVIGRVDKIDTAGSGSMLVVITPLGEAAEAASVTFTAPAFSGGAKAGDECVYFLSKALRRFKATGRGATGGSGVYEQQFLPYCKSGSTYLSTSPYAREHSVAVDAAQGVVRKVTDAGGKAL